MALRRMLLTDSVKGFAPDPEIPEAWKAVQSIQEPWSQIVARCRDGSYKDAYSLGDTKVCSFGDEGLSLMYVVGIDKDTRADGQGKAALTWMGQHVLKTNYSWAAKPSGDRSFDQGGTSKGYGDLNISTEIEALISKLQPELQEGIVEVTKMYNTRVSKTGAPYYTESYKSKAFKIWVPNLIGEIRKRLSQDEPYIFSSPYSNRPSQFCIQGSDPESGSAITWFRDIQSLSNIYIGNAHITNIPSISAGNGRATLSLKWYESYPIIPCFCT